MHRTPGDQAAARSNPPVPGTTTPAQIADHAQDGTQAHTALIKHDTASDFASAQVEGLSPITPDATNGYGLWTLAPGATTGTLTSSEIATPFPFTEAVASWNAWAPAGGEVAVQLRARLENGTWTGWYTMGIWSGAQDNTIVARSVSDQEDSAGKIDIDTLQLTTPGNGLQYRVTLSSTLPGANPTLRLAGVVYADTRSRLDGTPPQVSGDWARDLPVPARSQLIEEESLRWDICSPTSVGMVLAYYGRNVSTLQACRGVQDAQTQIYGNWSLNAAYAATNGMEAYVDRFYSIDQLKQEIANGHPVVISINFKPGQLDNSPLTKTNGHLLVVRGFTPDGNVIVNDPAAPDNSTVRRIYRADQLANVWIGNAGGIVYIIHPLP